MINLLSTLLSESFEVVLSAKDSLPRDFAFPKTEEMVKVAIGIRRSGKSYFLYQTINHLLESGVDKEQILIVNFEDDRILPMTAKEMGALLDEFYTMTPDNHNRRCYFFLDEVQNVDDWARVVRRFHDSKDVQLYLTGSSAKLLSKEIATSLRGRSLSIEIWPYDFREYLLSHKITLPKKPLAKKDVDHLRKHLLEFFHRGGFPAVQNMPINEWRDTLQGYVDTVILRDIVERYNVTNLKLLKYLTTTLLKNAATLFSVNKFYNDIRSQGYKIGKDTIHTYLAYLEDAFLVFSVPLYSESERLKQTHSKKIYAIDNGLVNANSLGTNELLNKFFENQIYLDLRRQNKDIYYYQTKGGFEIDFVAIAKDGKKELIQVCWELSDPKTREREERALVEAEKELKIKGRIVTMEGYLTRLRSE